MTTVPRAAEPSLVDEPRVAHALRVTFIAISASAVAISAFTLFLKWPLIPELALAGAASSLVALLLSHSGRIKVGMLLALLSITYAVLHAAAVNDGIQSIGLAILPVLMVVSGLLLDRRRMALFAVAAILATFGMLFIRYFVLRAEEFSSNDMGDFFIFALTCSTAALIGRLLAVRIGEAFRLARDIESRYRCIFENVHDVYYEMNRDSVLLEVSPASAALFGSPREEMIGRPLAPFWMKQSDFDALRAALPEQGRVSNREMVMRISGAAVRHVLVNASLQKGSKTGDERIVGTIRDAT